VEFKLGSGLSQDYRHLDPHLHVSFIFKRLAHFFFSNFVPISLIVTLEIVKFWQGTFMGFDLLMYDQDQGFAMNAKTTNINEELG